ncbi:L-proline amide hydrolase [Candidatus Planktophila limnetica]|uniref:Proline iminopeptidase n=1 Tax=Candidatus Planktophila limnetica TaxID=573600 RepID=A0A249LFR1_9ACTN|nr:proline iminopeptidase-family hydrolase [Candidatus Planktophila limnetica]ASY27948.1 L-proline amide hydrolase [Candidatus Planktophila limnetica]
MSEMKWQHGSTWYRVVGDLKSSKTPVMILHGGPGAGHNYCEPIAEVLAQTGRAGVLYDQIGCGNSTHLPDKPKEFWTPELFMEELVLLTEHLGISNKYDIVGQSWGGMLGMQFAITKPKGLNAMVIADSPASMEVWVSEANKLRKELPPEVEATLLKHEAAETTEDPEYVAAVDVFYSRHLCRIPQPPYVLASFEQLAADPTVYHTMNGPSEFHVIGSLKHWDIRPQLKEISTPTLLVSGQYDEATPAMVKEIQGLIPGSKWELFAESSHMPHVEEPAKFKRVVSEFLDSHD